MVLNTGYIIVLNKSSHSNCIDILKVADLVNTREKGKKSGKQVLIQDIDISKLNGAHAALKICSLKLISLNTHDVIMV